MARKRLTSEDMDLWRQVTEQTERLASTAVLPPRDEVTERRVKPRVLPKTVEPAPKPKPKVAPTGLNMDRKAFGRMKRGKLAPEARIDLHGMTLDRAHPALTQFILSSHGSGKRLVLVITGKGKGVDDRGPLPVPKGVLKRQVPHWLSIPPLAQAVLQVSSAHISHGGDGALYVYLRRTR